MSEYKRLVIYSDGTSRELAEGEVVEGAIKFEDLPRVPITLVETSKGVIIKIRDV